MLKTAIILAGGFGTRLQTVVKDVPKPMAPVNNEPFLSYQLKFLAHYGIQTVIFSVGHLASAIETHYKNNYNGLQILYATENEPLGTGGGLRLALGKCTDQCVLVLNGDSFFDIDIKEFYRLHTEIHSRISIALRKVNDASRYGRIQVDADHGVVSFSEKNSSVSEGLINGGVYILDRKMFMDNTPVGTKFSLEKDFFEKQTLNSGMKGFEFKGYFIDIGIPDDYQKAQHEFKEFKY